VYFIVRPDKEKRTGPYSDENPEYRRAFGEAQEKYAHLSPREMSPVRRFAIKKSRFQGKRPEIIAEAAAVRELMEREING
jgi:hypothetical protein